MKESAGGDDEITVTMIRSAGEDMINELWKLVGKLWSTPPGEWEDEVHRSAVILLFKNNGSNKDLKNYRGISLLSIVSQIVARVCAKRLVQVG